MKCNTECEFPAGLCVRAKCYSVKGTELFNDAWYDSQDVAHRSFTSFHLRLQKLRQRTRVNKDWRKERFRHKEKKILLIKSLEISLWKFFSFTRGSYLLQTASHKQCRFIFLLRKWSTMHIQTKHSSSVALRSRECVYGFLQLNSIICIWTRSSSQSSRNILNVLGRLRPTLCYVDLCCAVNVMFRQPIALKCGAGIAQAV